MPDSLTLGSLFDGIGGWLLAATECGIRPVWSSEIDEFPMAVSKFHFPDVVQLGDITKINGAEIEPVDIICAGSPCQDLSVAGKRKGLEGKRSGLFMDSVRIVREMREVTNEEYPKWFVWENVPGAYSSNKGNDFRAVLEEITETKIPMPGSGRWSGGGLVRSSKCDVAWRTLDAQYWGVPQRRARIFLVADFRASRRPEVLFEPESVPWNTEESQGKREDIAGDIRANADESSGTVFRMSGKNSRGFLSDNPNVGVKKADTCCTLDMNAGNPACNQGGIMVVEKPREIYARCVGNGQVHQLYLQDTVGALNCMKDQQKIIYALDRASFNQGKNAKYDFRIEKNKCSTLVAKGPSAVLVEE